MSSNKLIATQTHYFHSLNQQYAGSEIPDLQLSINNYGDDSVEIELKNLHYKQQRQQKIKQLLLVLILYVSYCVISFVTSKNSYIFLWDMGFLLWFLYTFYTMCCLVQSEKLLFCLDFALQPQTVYFLSRVANIFIPAASIHDVVINEVIEDLDVHYLLIVRTRGALFKRKPIFALFNTLQPSIACLEMIYKSLNKIIKKNIQNK